MVTAKVTHGSAATGRQHDRSKRPALPLPPHTRTPIPKFRHRSEPPAPRRGAFSLLALCGYMLATRYKTLYRWLHGGYMRRKTKNPAIF